MTAGARHRRHIPGRSGGGRTGSRLRTFRPKRGDDQSNAGNDDPAQQQALPSRHRMNYRTEWLSIRSWDGSVTVRGLIPDGFRVENTVTYFCVVRGNYAVSS